MNPDWRKDRFFLGVAATSLLVKLVLAVLARHDAPVLDEAAYLSVATQLADGQGFPGTFRPPGYPALMALLLIVGAGTVGVRLLQVALSMVSVWSAYRLGHRFGGLRAARAAAAILAFDPVIIAFTHRLWSETLFIALVLVVADQLTSEQLPWWRVVLAGSLLGLAALVRPMILTFVPFLAVWLVVVGRRSATGPGRGLARGLGRTGVFTAAALLVIAPWTARNVRVAGTFVLIDSNSPFNLLVGAEPASRFVDKDDLWSASFGVVDGIAYTALVESDARRAQRGALTAAWTHIRKDFGGFMEKSLWEAAHLWTLDSFLLRHLRNGWYRIKAPSWAVTGVTIVSVVFSAVLCLAGVAGLVLSSRSGPALLGLLMLLHATLLFGATYALSRYAVPLRPILALGAACVVAVRWGELWSGAARWQRGAVLAAWALLLASWIRDVPLLSDMVTDRGASHRFMFMRDAGRVTRRVSPVSSSPCRRMAAASGAASSCVFMDGPDRLPRLPVPPVTSGVQVTTLSLQQGQIQGHNLLPGTYDR